MLEESWTLPKHRKKALDDALVAPENRLMIRKCNQRLSSTLKSNEPTIQVALDALKLTHFYNAFEVSADVPEIYMHEFWATVTKHHFLLQFKLNGKSHTVNVDNFRDMLKICPKLPGQKFEEPLFEEEILPLIRDLGHTGDIKVISDANINHMHQPWRSLAAIINKCLSGKTTGLERLRLSRAQLLWGMYYNKYIDYVYLLWEDFVFQVENKDSKKNNDMFYPRFTKVIIDYFMAKDPSISRRNKMFWHTVRDDSMFTTIRVISKHQDTQIYDANLPQQLTNQAMLESEAYKTYRAYATGEKTPKPKKKKADSESSPNEKPAPASKGKRVKTSSKAAQSTKEKQPATKSKAKGLTVLSEVALTEDEQMKLATKRSWIQTHSSHAIGSGDGVDTLSKVPDEQPQKKSGTDKGAGDKPEVPDVPKYNSDSEEESWTFSDGNDDDDVNEESDAHDDSDENESDDEGDDFVHPNLSTYTPDDQDEEENVEDEEEAEDDEDISDQRVHTPPDYQLSEESKKQEDDDVEAGEEYGDEEMLYGDLNLNRERINAEMTEAHATKDTEDANENLTAVTPVVQQQSSFASDLVSKFLNPSTDEVTALESELSMLKHLNLFAEAISSIPGIIDKYLATKMKEAVDVAIQLKSNKLKEEAQAENQDFINSLDSNMTKIIKQQVKAQTSKIMSKLEKYVTDTLGAEVLVRTTNQPQTSYAVASSLSKLELKKILMDKMEENKSIDRSEVQKNLYNALVEAYNTDKDIISTYGDVVTISRGHGDEDKDEEPSVGSNRWTKRRRSGKETESTNEPTHKESRTTSSSRDASRSQPTDLDESTHQEFNTGDDDQALPLIPNARGHLVIPFDHFINNDLEYLKGGNLSHKYTTSITKTKAADYGQIKWIEDMIPRSMWSTVPVVYDKHAYWGTYHWGPKRQRFYGYANNMETSKDVYSKHKIIAVISLKIMTFYGYSHLEEITSDERYALNVALRMYTRRIVIQERVEDLQLAVESYQKKINLSRPDSQRSDLRKMTLYTTYPDIKGVIYQDDMNRNRLMRTDELHKFSDGTLNHVRTALNDIAIGIQMEYLPKRR
ncbi:hypothetical protein Tco_0706591 [Tanacetum coccineum]|uniref:Uncharacterized protein n=1 Tax=Tanacetum coccineum TaxID=301880 RepID=A0ABQ4Y9W3_9ASTR